jgi:hypothetical protein
MVNRCTLYAIRIFSGKSHISWKVFVLSERSNSLLMRHADDISRRRVSLLSQAPTGAFLIRVGGTRNRVVQDGRGRARRPWQMTHDIGYNRPKCRLHGRSFVLFSSPTAVAFWNGIVARRIYCCTVYRSELFESSDCSLWAWSFRNSVKESKDSRLVKISEKAWWNLEEKKTLAVRIKLYEMFMFTK